jgi:hypothetical protein
MSCNSRLHRELSRNLHMEKDAAKTKFFYWRRKFLQTQLDLYTNLYVRTRGSLDGWDAMLQIESVGSIPCTGQICSLRLPGRFTDSSSLLLDG